MFASLSVVLAVPLQIDPEEIEVGRAVFHHFVHDEFEHVGMSDEALIEQNQNHPDEIIDEHLAIAHGIVFGDGRPGTPEGYKNILINNIGGSIRELANEFAQSSQREKIRIHADTVDLGHINQERFWGLLQEVFRDGVNVYNIVALFYFCSDVLIRCVKQQLFELGINLFKWSLNYIADKVCRWAQNHGGWEKALRKVIAKRYFAYCTAAVIGFAIAWGLYKGLKS